jgi:hypothetical protein
MIILTALTLIFYKLPNIKHASIIVVVKILTQSGTKRHILSKVNIIRLLLLGF